ncbi:MAG: c-type cytochrome, partial [Ignavibacteria bacterium]
YSFDILAYSFQGGVLIRFVFYLVLSFSVTFSVSLFFNFVWEDTKLELSEGLSQFIEEHSLTGAFVTVLLQPVLILIDVLILPKSSLSYWIFLSSGISIIFLFLIANQLNAYRKEKLNSYLRFSFYFMVFALVFISIKDVVAFANVMKPKTVEISQKFLTYEENLKTKLNIKTVTISGEEVFTAKCSACHRFDQKLVGPPYNVVLKKYEDKKDQLVKFILNPVKVDPAYPPMPSQGLIPPEAEAVAEYIMKVYKEKQK